MRNTGIQQSAKREWTIVIVQRLAHQRVTHSPATLSALISLKFFKVGFSGIDEWVFILDNHGTAKIYSNY